MVYNGGLCEHDIEYIPIIWKHLFFAPKKGHNRQCNYKMHEDVWDPHLEAPDA